MFSLSTAVEKYLKAFLFSRDIDIGKTHNIDLLIKTCAKIDKEFDMIDPKDLSTFAVDIRYPDVFIYQTCKKLSIMLN